ncbi:Hypothetical protein SRAE_2000160000 [Strongyloides ratti]|uniref:Uncharacterized protein n=1 Tax=Strongyloides ratti TaxID=34506 RepID=A0A090MYC3_STRRB|nr:Hypothetical protein SRAE_2000160000 [Strongyloides ratti]CEF66934.1 Hypothetical protein SRAE_2000160000 [Strongyloides ratti]
MTVAIWSSIYSLCLLFLFGWQTGVLSQCSEVTMAQANLKCEYYCPCVGASTARTSRIIEGLFIIQILCLIVSFFLLFASLALVYGIHNKSRYLIWPWFPCMISSVLTSTAYCIIWWVGDVRDYWLAITICLIILQFINAYCFVVIIIFYGKLQKNGSIKDDYIGGQIMTNNYLGNHEEEYDEEIKDYNISKKDVPLNEGKQNLNYYNDKQFIEDNKIKKDIIMKRDKSYEEDSPSNKVKLTVCSCKKCRQHLSGKKNYKDGRRKRKYSCCEDDDSNNGTDTTICNKKKYSYDEKSCTCRCSHKKSTTCSYYNDIKRRQRKKKYKSYRPHTSTISKHLNSNDVSRSKKSQHPGDLDNVIIPQNIYIPKTTGPQFDEQGNPIKNKYIIDSEYTFNY